MADFGRQTSTITIAAPPDSLYEIVTDVSRTDEWSPVCKSAEWDEGAGPGVGAMFTGHNDDGERQWSMRCRVFVADPGKEFVWATVGMVGNDDIANDDGLTRWGYTFTPVDGGTEVEESWELTPSTMAMFQALPEEQQEPLKQRIADQTVSGMQATLENLKRVAEAG